MGIKFRRTPAPPSVPVQGQADPPTATGLQRSRPVSTEDAVLQPRQAPPPQGSTSGRAGRPAPSTPPRTPHLLSRLGRSVSHALQPPARPLPDTSMGVFGNARGVNRDTPLASRAERPPRVHGVVHEVAGMAAVERQHGVGQAAALPPRIPAMDFASVLRDMKHRPRPDPRAVPTDEPPPERNRFPTPDPAADTRRLRQALTAPPAGLDGLGADAPTLSRLQRTLPLAAPALHRPLMDQVFKTRRPAGGPLAGGTHTQATAPHLQDAQQHLMQELRAKEAVRVAKVSRLRTQAYIARAERNLLDAQDHLHRLERLHRPQAGRLDSLRQQVALRMVFHPDTLPADAYRQVPGMEAAAALAERLQERQLAQDRLAQTITAPPNPGEPDAAALRTRLEAQEQAIDTLAAQLSPAQVSQHLQAFTAQVDADLQALRDLPADARIRVLGPQVEGLLHARQDPAAAPDLQQLAAHWRPAELAQRLADTLARAEAQGQHLEALRQDLGWPLRKISSPAVEAQLAPFQQAQADALAEALVLRQAASLGTRLRLLPRVQAAATLHLAGVLGRARHAQAAAGTGKLLEPARQAVQEIQADLAAMRAHLQAQEQQAPALAQALDAARLARRDAERATSHALLGALHRHGFPLAHQAMAPGQPAPEAALQMALADLYLRLDQRAARPDGHPEALEPRASSPAMVLSATVQVLAEASGGDAVLAAAILDHLGGLHLTGLVRPEAGATEAGAGALRAAVLLAQVPRGMEVLQHLTGYQGLAALQGPRPLAPDVEAVKVYLQARHALDCTPEEQPALRQFRTDALEGARLHALCDDPARVPATLAQRGAYHAFRNGMDSNAPGTDYDAVNRSLLVLGRWLGQLETPHRGAPMHDMSPLKSLDQAIDVLDATGGPSLRRIHSNTLRIATEHLLEFAMACPMDHVPSHEQVVLQSLLQALAYQPEDVDLGRLRATPAMWQQALAAAAARGLPQGGTDAPARALVALGEHLAAGQGLGVAELLQRAAQALADEESPALQGLREHLAQAHEQAGLLKSGQPANAEMFIRKLKYMVGQLQWRDRLKMSMIDTAGVNTDRPVSIPLTPFVSLQPKVILGVDRKTEVSLEFFMSSPAGPQIVFGTKRSTAMDLGAGLGVTVALPVRKPGFADAGMAEMDGTPVSVTSPVPAASLGGRAAVEARFKGERTRDESVCIRIPRYFGHEGSLHAQFVGLMQDLILIARDAHAAGDSAPVDPLLHLLAAQPAASVGRHTGQRRMRAVEASGDIGASAGLGGNLGGVGGGVGATVRREKADSHTHPRAHISWPTADSTVGTRLTTRLSTAYTTPPLYAHTESALTQTPAQAADAQATQTHTTLFSIPGVALGGTATSETRVAEFHKRMTEQTYFGNEHYYDLAAIGFETTDFKQFNASVMARLSQWADLAAIRAPAGIAEEDRYALGEKFVLDLLAQGEAVRRRNTTTSAISFDILFQELDAQVDHLNREAWFARRRGDTGTAAHIDTLLDELFSDPSARKVALMHVSNTTRGATRLGINQIAKIATVWQGESKSTMAQVPQANPIIDRPG